MRRALPILASTILVGLAGIGSAHAVESGAGSAALESTTTTATTTSAETGAYDVSASGVTLLAGATFPALAHVTYRATALDGSGPRTFGVTLTPDDAATVQHVGASTLRFDAAREAYPGGYCITRVEVALDPETDAVTYGDTGEPAACTVYPGVAIGDGSAEAMVSATSGLSLSGPAPIAGLVSVMVIAASAAAMVRFGAFQD